MLSDLQSLIKAFLRLWPFQASIAFLTFYKVLAIGKSGRAGVSGMTGRSIDILNISSMNVEEAILGHFRDGQGKV